jgi:hypothetical protein
MEMLLMQLYFQQRHQPEQLQMVFKIQLLDKCFQLISAGHQLEQLQMVFKYSYWCKRFSNSTETSAVSWQQNFS